jgi:hypothetical protein
MERTRPALSPRDAVPFHVVVAKTATAERRQEVDIHEGEQKQIELMLVSTGRAAVEPPPPTPELPATPSPSRTSHAPNTVTWIGVGLAGAGVIIGSVTGVMAMSKGAGLPGECDNHQCGPAAHSDLASAYSAATVSDATFAAAGVGLVLAAVSLMVGHESSAEAPVGPPSASGPTAHLWLGFGAGGLRGTF